MHAAMRRRSLSATTILLAALSGGLTTTAYADPAPAYRALLEQSQTAAPRLAQAQAEIGRATGLAGQAAVRPNPTLGLEVENFAGDGPFRDFSGAEMTVSVAQTLELGGKRQARIAAGGADLDLARARTRQAQADFAFDLAQAYAQAEASERRVQLAVEGVTLAEEDARVAGALVRAGKEADLRVIQAGAAIQSARAALEEARAASAAAFGTLTALSGSEQPLTSIPVSLLAHADSADVITAPDTLAAPNYVAARAAKESASRRVQVERSRRAPDLTASFGLRRLNGDSATAMVGGISAPLPLFDNNAGAIAAARAELTGAEALVNGARLDAIAQARSSALRAAAAQTRIIAARDGEAAAAEAYRLTRIGYEGGKLSLIELNTARHALSEARGQTIDARLERIGAEAALARLQGVAPFGDQ